MERALKILMLGWELPPHNSGGLGVACYQLCKALNKQSADIEFILPYVADYSAIDFMRVNPALPQSAQQFMTVGNVYDSKKYTSNGDRHQPTIFNQAALFEEAVGKIAEQNQYDIIHAHDWLTCRAAIRAKMLTGLPLVVHFHSIESDRAGRAFGGNPLVRDIEQTAVLLADHVIAVSEYTKKAIVREYGVPADKIAVVHNHTDVQELLPEQGENAYTYISNMRRQGYHTIVYVGRLTIQKGVPNLLKAFQAALQHAPKTFLLVVGDGEQKFELIQQAADLGIARNVFFTGFLRGKKWRDAYGLSDLFVMPSISEPFGLTALEAIGYGTPALISKQSGVAEVLHNTLKVDFWDTDEMANKMVALVQNDALRDELQHNSYQELLSHSWDNSADTLLGLYQQHVSEVAA